MNKLSLEMLTAEDTPLTSIKLGRKDDLDDLNLSGTKLASVDISGCSRQLEAVTDTTWPYTVSKGVIYWDGSDAPLTINTTTKESAVASILSFPTAVGKYPRSGG